MAWATRAGTALVVAWLVTPVTAVAQLRGPQFGVAAGATFPIGDWHANAAGVGYKVGWQGRALVAFQGRGSRVGFEVDALYGVHASNDSLNLGLTRRYYGSPTTAKTTFLGGDVDLTVTLPSPTRVKPYLLGGFGLYRVTVSLAGGATGDTSGGKFAWLVGGGFTVGLGGAAVFVDMRYVHVDAIEGFPKTPFFPILAGVRFGGR